MTASARQPSFECRICRSQLPNRHLAITILQLLRWPAAVPVLVNRRGGGRNARATSRALRVSGCVSPGNSRRNCHPLASSAAIIRPAQECSRFAELTFRHLVVRGNTKNVLPCEEAVEDVSSLWTAEEN